MMIIILGCPQKRFRSGPKGKSPAPKWQELRIKIKANDIDYRGLVRAFYQVNKKRRVKVWPVIHPKARSAPGKNTVYELIERKAR